MSSVIYGDFYIQVPDFLRSGKRCKLLGCRRADRAGVSDFLVEHDKQAGRSKRDCQANKNGGIDNPLSCVKPQFCFELMVGTSGNSLL